LKIVKEFTGYVMGLLQDFISLFALKHKVKLPKRYPVTWPRIEARSCE